MNINPFNIWGSSFQNITFGPKFYKGIKYFQDLFKKEGLLEEIIVDDTQETYENSIEFIRGLRTNGIILFDSADYLLKPFLYDRFISKEEASEMIKTSPLLPTKDEQETLIKYLDFEVSERQTKGQPGIPVPYEWYIETLGAYVNCEQAVETFGYGKARTATEKTHPGELLKLKKMAEDYSKQYIERFTTQEQKTDPIRCIEHRRIILKLIDVNFPIDINANKDPLTQTKDALLNKALKRLVFYPSVNTLNEIFSDTMTSGSEEIRTIVLEVPEQTHLDYIKSINQKIFMQCEKWFSTYRFSVIAPKVYFDFTGLLFIMNNLSNEEFLNPLTEAHIKGKTKPKIIDTDKIQNQIFEKCIHLKNKTESEKGVQKKPPNAYIVKLIENVKKIHTNLENFTIVTDLEGDDLTAIITAYNFFPKDIQLNIIIQHSTGIKDMTMPDAQLKFKEESLEKWCKENNLPSSLLTVDSMLSFYIEELQIKHRRANFTTIDINYAEMIPIIRELLANVNIIDVVSDTTVEFFEYIDSTTTGKLLQQVIKGISPNICKVADALLQLYKTDSSLIARLVNYIRSQEAHTARKYLKKNIY